MILVVLKVQKVSSIQTCGVWTILVYINWCIKLYNHAQWTTENICIGRYKTWGGNEAWSFYLLICQSHNRKHS